MSYPKFYDAIERIKVKDPLSELLGAAENGKYEFTYYEIVKSAGHSCPTIAGAYLMTLKGLEKLYPESLPIRGEIEVSFKEGQEDGTAGVIANVVTQITGATDKSGFKGLQGKFSRHSLMSFNVNIMASARLTRVDTQKSVDIFYDPAKVAANPDMQVLMQKIFQEKASLDEVKEFGVLWQDRVKRIFENVDKVIQVEEL